jgi:hypothetical protein
MENSIRFFRFAAIDRWIASQGDDSRSGHPPAGPDRVQGEGREAIVTARRKRGWSYKDDRRLIQLAASLKSLEAVAGEMRRSRKNILRMAKRLGVFLKSAEEEMSPPKPARRYWTADELKNLDELTKAGKTAVEIATVLQRTPTSIYAKLQAKRLLAEPKGPVAFIRWPDPFQLRAGPDRQAQSP